MTIGLGLNFAAFVLLGGATLVWRRGILRRRRAREWWIDGAGLVVQGTIIPLAVLGLARFWTWLLPAGAGTGPRSVGLAIALHFVIIDYGYYWNHRGLHRPGPWRWHRLHHSARAMDIFMNSRNSLLTPLCLVFLWSNSIVVYWLKDPAWFLLASALGSALDLWRHSGFSLPRGKVYRFLSPWLVLPQDHSWHHAHSRVGCNFGFNLILWDRCHGTLYRPEAEPLRWGEDESLNLREFFAPRADA